MPEQSPLDAWLDLAGSVKNNLAVNRTGEGERVDTRQALVNALKATLDEYPGAAAPIGALRGAGLELPLAGFQGLAALSGDDQGVSDMAHARRELQSVFDEATQDNPDPGVRTTGDIASLFGAAAVPAKLGARLVGKEGLTLTGREAVKQGVGGGAAVGLTLGSTDAETARDDLKERAKYGAIDAAAGGVIGKALRGGRRALVGKTPLEKQDDNLRIARALGYDDFYHGTGKTFDRYDPALAGTSQATKGERASFMTSSPRDANWYARQAAGRTRHGEGANIRRELVNSQNQYRSKIRGYDPDLYAQEIRKATEQGYDSVLFPRVRDNSLFPTRRHVAVINPDIVKPYHTDFTKIAPNMRAAKDIRKYGGMHGKGRSKYEPRLDETPAQRKERMERGRKAGFEIGETPDDPMRLANTFEDSVAPNMMWHGGPAPDRGDGFQKFGQDPFFGYTADESLPYSSGYVNIGTPNGGGLIGLVNPKKFGEVLATGKGGSDGSGFTIDVRKAALKNLRKRWPELYHSKAFKKVAKRQKRINEDSILSYIPPPKRTKDELQRIADDAIANKRGWLIKDENGEDLWINPVLARNLRAFHQTDGGGHGEVFGPDKVFMRHPNAEFRNMERSHKRDTLASLGGTALGGAALAKAMKDMDKRKEAEY